ncbi:MAG: TadE-like protein [Syntrophus sp. PtaB.Bin001]|nr:MAG: TadE-like protein [Syntrophus sp. PtaB.Bin001]
MEFALVAPIFFLLLFAIFDFGWYFFTQHTIQYATREGTRIAVVGTQTQITNNGTTTTLSRLESIIKAIEDNAAMAVDPNELKISIYPIDNSSYSDPTNWETKQEEGTGGQIMRVRVRYTYTFFTPFIGNFFTSGQKLITAQALYKNESF